MSKVPVIAIVGSTSMDLTCYADVLPSPGQTLFGNSFTTGFGGKGANQAVMASLAGAQVYMVGSIGTDMFGQSCIENFKNQKVNSDFVKVSDLPTGVAHIWVDATGENRIIVVPGANHDFDEKFATDAVSAIPNLSIVLGQCEVPQSVTASAFKRAKERGCLTMFNPAPFQELSSELMEVTDWLTPNEVEFEQITGSAPENFDLKEFRKGKNSLITLGSKGVILISETGEITRIPTEEVAVVDTTGAGDCFIGSFAYALGCGLEPKAAAKFACRVASISVTRKGAQSSYPNSAEISKIS